MNVAILSFSNFFAIARSFFLGPLGVLGLLGPPCLHPWFAYRLQVNCKKTRVHHKQLTVYVCLAEAYAAPSLQKFYHGESDVKRVPCTSATTKNQPKISTEDCANSQTMTRNFANTLAATAKR
jgi:hypothetical protein